MARNNFIALFSLVFLSLIALSSCDRTTPDNGSGPTTQPDAGSPAAPTPSAHQADFSDLPAPYAQADYSLGRRTFKNCQSCHTVAEGARHLVGPNLHGIFGRTVGSVSDFQYSDALASADFAWTPERLEEWLTDPRGYLPGNRMSFSGVRRPEARHAVIAYLMVESGYDGATAPGPSQEPAD